MLNDKNKNDKSKKQLKSTEGVAKEEKSTTAEIIEERIVKIESNEILNDRDENE